MRSAYALSCTRLRSRHARWFGRTPDGRARLLKSLVSLQWGHLEALVSPSPNQVIFKSNVLAMDKLSSGEMAPSPVTCASLSGYPSIMLRSRPFYGCATLNVDIQPFKRILCFLHAAIQKSLVLDEVDNFLFKSPPLDVHEKPPKSSVCPNEIFLAKAHAVPFQSNKS